MLKFPKSIPIATFPILKFQTKNKENVEAFSSNPPTHPCD